MRAPDPPPLPKHLPPEPRTPTYIRNQCHSHSFYTAVIRNLGNEEVPNAILAIGVSVVDQYLVHIL